MTAPTTLHARVAHADPEPSRQGPAAFKPGNPVWNAGYETFQKQAVEMLAEWMAWQPARGAKPDRDKALLDMARSAILAMRPKPPTMEGTP